MKKDSTESLKRHIATLEAKIARLERENERLDYENKVLSGREDFVQEMYVDYKALLDDIRAIKEKYSEAVSEIIEMRNTYKDEFKRLLKTINKR